MSHRLIVCYEMAEEFVQLYLGQTLEPQPVPLAANEPIARNIKTQGSSKAAPAEDAKVASGRTTELDAKIASVARLELLADAMAAQTVEFFAPPAGLAPAELPAVHVAHE